LAAVLTEIYLCASCSCRNIEERNGPGQLAPISGAVDAGVNKAVQTVSVFVAADWAFCDAKTNPRACFSTEKGQSLVLVVSGVLLYSYFSAQGNSAAAKGKTWAAAAATAAAAAEEDDERAELLGEYHAELVDINAGMNQGLQQHPATGDSSIKAMAKAKIQAVRLATGTNKSKGAAGAGKKA
jgi:hypothetical protein